MKIRVMTFAILDAASAVLWYFGFARSLLLVLTTVTESSYSLSAGSRRTNQRSPEIMN